MPWVADGVTVWEGESIDWLAQIARENEPAASRILDMPFLGAHEPEDAVTLEALYNSDHHGKLDSLLSQPVFRGGIGQADIPLAIFGAFVARLGRDDGTLERVLTPGYADIVTQSQGTEMSPHLRISIATTGFQAEPWLVDAVVDAVALVERLMGASLPVAHVVMLIGDESSCGCTYGFAFDSPLQWHRPKDTREGQLLQGHIAHELFHEYIQRAEWWLYDGTAEAFKYIYGVEHGDDLEAYMHGNRGECEAHDLQMYTEWAISPGEPGSGLRLFPRWKLVSRTLGTSRYG